MDLIVADLDGSTLSDETDEISREDISSVENWISRGNVFSIATGRPFFRVVKFIKQLNVNFPVILCNGAMIYNVQNDVQNLEINKTKIYNAKNLEIIGYLDPIKINELLIDLILNNSLQNLIIFFKEDVQIFNANEDLINAAVDWKERYDNFDGVALNWKIEYINNIEKIKREPILMLSFYRSHSKLNNIISTYLDKFNIEFSSSDYIDLLPTGISKGHSLKKILENRDFENIYVVGNAKNDLSMLFDKNKLIAVKNAVSEILEKAFMVISSNNNNPLSDLIKNI